MSFPERPYAAVSGFASAYFDLYATAARAVSAQALDDAAALLAACYRAGNWLYVCGNGGSAAIANHMYCDHVKSVRTDTSLTPRMMSLSANVEMMSALANDISYAEVFAYQIEALARPGDVVMTISSSGNSENVVRAIAAAQAKGLKTIALTGFQGGRTATMADVNIHVPVDNYGIVEDLHQSIMHILAQAIRAAEMPADLVSIRTF